MGKFVRFCKDKMNKRFEANKTKSYSEKSFIFFEKILQICRTSVEIHLLSDPCNHLLYSRHLFNKKDIVFLSNVNIILFLSTIKNKKRNK